MQIWAKTLTSLLLLLSPQRATFQAQLSSPGGSGATWTVVQHKNNFTCSTTNAGVLACSVTVTSTTAGNLLIMLSSAFSGNGKPTFSSASGDGGTWTHPSVVANENYSAANWENTDAVYILSASGGATSVSFSWSFPNSSAQNNIDVEFLEIHRSIGSATFDAGSTNTSGSCSSCTGSNITISGSSDYIVSWIAQENSCTALTAPYSNPFDNENSNVVGAYGGALNQSSGTAPTFTCTAGGAAISGMAFK